jgi:hypothetical protein
MEEIWEESASQAITSTSMDAWIDTPEDLLRQPPSSLSPG